MLCGLCCGMPVLSAGRADTMSSSTADLTFGGSPAGPAILGVGVGAFTFTVRKVCTVP